MLVEALIAAFVQWDGNNPGAVGRGLAAINKASEVDTNRFAAFADMSQQILRCYHPTARYKSSTILESPWSQQSKYNATSSSVIQIEYVGLTNAIYSMRVGLVQRANAVRTTVIADSAKITASARCKLENWVELSP